MPIGTSKRSGSPDTSLGHQLATVPVLSDTNIQLPVGVSAANTFDTKTSAHRSNLTGIDTASDMSSAGFGTSLYSLNNDANLLFWGEANVSSGSITVIPIYYDTAGVPLFEGDTVTLTCSGRRVSSTGKFLTTYQQIPANGAARVKLYVTTIGGWWDLFLDSM